MEDAMSSTTVSASGAAKLSGAAARIDALGPSGRMREAETFTRAELSIWAARYPEEVPMVNGEFAWIGLRLADLE